MEIKIQNQNMASKVKEEHVELGFAEEADRHSLTCRHFPSKIGGKPAWLSLTPLPSPSDIACQSCGNVMVFLLQVYAPDTDKKEAFHRTLFLFICKKPSCCVRNSNKSFVIFRSQLSRENDFYSSEPPNVKQKLADEPSPEKYQDMCCVCGIPGPKRCSKCHQRSYCCKEHQVLDWKNGHKQACSQSSNYHDYYQSIFAIHLSDIRHNTCISTVIILNTD